MVSWGLFLALAIISIERFAMSSMVGPLSMRMPKVTGMP